jgi:hypothetical protein
VILVNFTLTEWELKTAVIYGFMALKLLPGLPPFAGAKTGRKNIRVPPLIITKKIFLNFVNNILIQSI